MAKPKKNAPAVSAGSSRSTRLLLWGVLVYASLSLGHLLLQEYRLMYQGQILKTEMAATEAKAQELRAAIAYAKTPQGLERLARKNLGMARIGERPVRFLTPQDGARNI